MTCHNKKKKTFRWHLHIQISGKNLQYKGESNSENLISFFNSASRSLFYKACKLNKTFISSQNALKLQCFVKCCYIFSPNEFHDVFNQFMSCNMLYLIWLVKGLCDLCQWPFIYAKATEHCLRHMQCFNQIVEGLINTFFPHHYREVFNKLSCCITISKFSFVLTGHAQNTLTGTYQKENINYKGQCHFERVCTVGWFGHEEITECTKTGTKEDKELACIPGCAQPHTNTNT